MRCRNEARLPVDGSCFWCGGQAGNLKLCFEFTREIRERETDSEGWEQGNGNKKEDRDSFNLV